MSKNEVVEISEETMSLIAPGHVWRRTDTGREAKVLLVGNMHLKGNLSKVYPVSVTYVDDKGNIATVPATTFVHSREYYIVDPLLETRLLSLFDEEEEEEEDTKEAEDDNEGAETDPDTEEDTEEDGESYLVGEFVSTLNSATPELASETIFQNILQFEQDPDFANNELRNKLILSLDEVVTTQALDQAFGNPAGPIYGSFIIQGIEVNWKRYLGAYPVVDADGEVSAQLIFTSPLQFLAQTEETEDAENNEEVPLTDPNVISDVELNEAQADLETLG